jgi:hypothetical protein
MLYQDISVSEVFFFTIPQISKTRKKTGVCLDRFIDSLRFSKEISTTCPGWARIITDFATSMFL